MPEIDLMGAHDKGKGASVSCDLMAMTQSIYLTVAAQNQKPKASKKKYSVLAPISKLKLELLHYLQISVTM